MTVVDYLVIDYFATMYRRKQKQGLREQSQYWGSGAVTSYDLMIDHQLIFFQYIFLVVTQSDNKGLSPCSAKKKPQCQEIMSDIKMISCHMYASLLLFCPSCRMTVSCVCLTRTYEQKRNPSCLQATTPQQLLSRSPCTAWPATQSTRRSAGTRSCRFWTVKTAWTGALRYSVGTFDILHDLCALVYFVPKGGSQ